MSRCRSPGARSGRGRAPRGSMRRIRRGARPRRTHSGTVRDGNEGGARGRSPEGSAAEAKRMRRQTAKDDRARRRRTCGTPSRAQGVRQRAGGVDRAAGAGRQKGCLFCCDKRSPGYDGRARRSLVRRTYPYASALVPALARLASGLPCLATKPFRGQAPCSGPRMPGSDGMCPWRPARGCWRPVRRGESVPPLSA